MVKLSISGILGIILLLLLSGCAQGDLAGEAYKLLSEGHLGVKGEDGRVVRGDDSDESEGGSDGGGGSGYSSSYWGVGDDSDGRYLYPKVEEKIRIRSANSQGPILSILGQNEGGASLYVEGTILGHDNAVFSQNLYVLGKMYPLQGICDNEGDNCFKFTLTTTGSGYWTLEANARFEDVVLFEEDVVFEQGDITMQEGDLIIESLKHDQPQNAAFELGQTAAYACIDGIGKLFRSDIPCDEFVTVVEEE